LRSIQDILVELTPGLERLEPTRLDYLKKSRLYLAILFLPLLGLLAAAFLSPYRIPLFVVAVLWFIGGMILYQYRAGSLGSRYLYAYKSAVVPKLLTLIDPGLAYDATDGISSEAFVDTELYTTTLPDRYSTEDLIHGAFGKTTLRLAEIDAEEKHTTKDSEGRTQTSYVTIFKGLLLIADFNKHFQGRTFAFPDFAESTFGNFGRMFQKWSGRRDTSLIRLEDPEFENAFAVYSTDEIEARYILSTALMRRLLHLRERFGKDVRIGFKESSIVLAVPHRENFLEPSTKVSALETGQIEKMLTELQYFLDLIEELDLNTRIWTKE
jgi:hypothetical protein